VLLCLLPWPKALRLSAALALVPAIWPLTQALRHGEFRLTVLDVGRALAVVAQTRTHTLLIDNGESWGSEGSVTRSVVVPSLRALGVDKIDLVLMPALDNDRAAGLVALAAEFPVARWLTGAREPPPEMTGCVRDSQWDWDGVQIAALNVPGCALRITNSAGASVLLAATVGAGDQQQLINSGLTPSTAVLVPRLGAATGYNPAFSAAVAARFALVSNSLAGASAHTVQQTIQGWRAAGATVLLTADVGAIELRSDGSALRAQMRR
jgi:competence protein ComEC